MSRIPVALVAGLLGFLLYVGAVVAFADAVLSRHWVLQLVYFTLAGTIWAWPAGRLMIWAARK